MKRSFGIDRYSRKVVLGWFITRIGWLARRVALHGALDHRDIAPEGVGRQSLALGLRLSFECCDGRSLSGRLEIATEKIQECAHDNVSSIKPSVEQIGLKFDLDTRIASLAPTSDH